MKSNMYRNIKLGVFVTAGMIIFLLASYLIGNDQNLFQDTFRLRAGFKNVSGLQKGNNVRFAGLHVGTVKDIQMVNDSMIMVDMVIEEKIRPHIRNNAVATVGSDGLVGSMVLNIVPGNREAAIVQPGDTLKSFTKLGTDDMISTLGVTGENAALLTAELLEIAREINQGKGTLGILLKDPEVAGDVRATMANLNKTSSEVTRGMTQLSEIIEQLNSDSGLLALLKDTTTTQKVAHTLDNISDTGDRLKTVSDQLQDVIAEINGGEGAVNYLLTNKEMVQKLDSILVNVESGTKKFDENMDAMRDNILFRSYFRKQEKEATKRTGGQ